MSALTPPPEAVDAAKRMLLDGATVEEMLAVVTPMIAAKVAEEFLGAVLRVSREQADAG